MSSWRKSPARLLSVVAWIVLGAGLLMSWRTWQTVAVVRDGVSTRRQETESLRQIEQELIPYYAAELALAGRAPDAPTPEAVLRETLKELSPDDVRTTDVELGDGWVLSRQNLVVPEVDLSAVMPQLSRIESSPLFWRLVRVDIHATSATPGRGQVSLEFELVVPPQ